MECPRNACLMKQCRITAQFSNFQVWYCCGFLIYLKHIRSTRFYTRLNSKHVFQKEPPLVKLRLVIEHKGDYNICSNRVAVETAFKKQTKYAMK